MTENGIGIGAQVLALYWWWHHPTPLAGPRQIPQLRESGGAGALNEDPRDQPQ